ncbi:MAG: DUF4249 domain-containing protein [Paludibacteraceae bacterium]|nr:DUF4249 domain-containing protein [Paludibacteraceae bacterium]
MNKKTILSLPLLLLALLNGCREEITIDVEEGEQLIGIYGCITNEWKKQQLTISKSGDFYGTGDPEMVSGAEVTVTDNDTAIINYQEVAPGIYETTEPIKGESGHIYKLHVIVHEKGETTEYYATDTMQATVESIDSIKVLPYTLNNIKATDYYKVCPYFQSINNKRTSYIAKIEINGHLVTDTLTEYYAIQFQEMTGIYINGKEMEKMYNGVDFPGSIYNLDPKRAKDEDVKPGDEITLNLHVISQGYLEYIYDVQGNSGSNPFYGSPANVSSNIKPEKRALGYFFTSAITKGTCIVRAEDLK